jgi:hypothetical protein
MNVPPAEILFVITQLRDVRAAGESAEVAVEHQQKPFSTVRLEPVDPTGTVPELERHGGFPGQVGHDGLLGVFPFPL